MSAVEGWEQNKLGNICSIEIGGTPSRNNPQYWDVDNSTPNYWVSIRDLNKRTIINTNERLSNLGVHHSNVKLQKKGTVLLSFKLSIGRTAFAGIDLFTNEAIAGLSTDSLDKNYLYYGLQHWDLLKGVDQAIKGATLNKAKLKEIDIFYPESIEEQTKIAEILSCIDTAIEQTEAIIAKQQRIKTGLMQDLLSKGIDEHGNIRSEYTHAFKDSPLGRIPEEWTLTCFDKVFQGSPRNGIYKPSNQIGEGVLLIGQTSFTEDRLIDFSLARRASVSQKEIDNYGIQIDDLLISRVFAVADKVGLPAFVQSVPESAVYESNMLRLRINNRLVYPKFIYFWLLSEPIRKLIILSINVSNQASINQQVLSALPLTMPDISEQKRILDVIEAETVMLANEKESLKKFYSLKTALMQDLLSGKVRVNQLIP